MRIIAFTLLAAAIMPLAAADGAAAAEPEVSRYTLADGRRIDGIYDKERGVIVLTGKIRMELAVKPEQIVKAEPLAASAVPDAAQGGGQQAKAGGKAAESSQEFAVLVLADFERAIEAERKTKLAALAAAEKAMQANRDKRFAGSGDVKDWDKYQAEQRRLAEQDEQLRKTSEQRRQEVNVLGRRWAFARAMRASLQKYSSLHERLLQSPALVWREDPKASFTSIADGARARFGGVMEKERVAQDEAEARRRAEFQQGGRTWNPQTVRRTAEQQKVINNELVSIYYDYYSNLFINTRMAALPKDLMELTPDTTMIINDYVGFHRRIVDYCRTNQKNVDPRILDVFVGIAKVYFPAMKQAPPQDFRAVITDYREFVDSVPGDIGAFDPKLEVENEFGRMRL